MLHFRHRYMARLQGLPALETYSRWYAGSSSRRWAPAHGPFLMSSCIRCHRASGASAARTSLAGFANESFLFLSNRIVALVHLLEVFSFGIRTSRMSMLDSIITHRTVPPSQLATIRIDERKTSKGLKTFRSTGGLIPSRPTSGFVLDPQGDTPLGSFSLGNVDRVPGFIIPSLPQFFPSRQTGNGLMVALISGTNLSCNLTGQDPARITL